MTFVSSLARTISLRNNVTTNNIKPRLAIMSNDSPKNTTGQTEDSPRASPEPMSDFEALMWNLGRDPWLNPSGAMVTVVDRPVNQKHFHRCIRQAVAAVPKLRQRVVPAPTRLTTPGWETDPEFDFDYHLRAIALAPSANSWRDLMEMAAWIYQLPYDTTRPLWQIITIDGLDGGRSAIFWKLHHTIGDATTMMRMAEFYMQLKRREKMPPIVDLDALFGQEVSTQPDRSNNPMDALADTAVDTLSTVAKKQGTMLRRAVGEMMHWGADPSRAVEFGQDAFDKATATVDQLRGAAQPDRQDHPVDGGEHHDSETTSARGSSLWQDRSRHRVLESLQVPLDQAKSAANMLGGSINDFFVAGAVIGSLRYHEAHGETVDWLHMSFVVSTRTVDDGRDNAFTPMRLAIPGQAMDLAQRFTDLQERMKAKKEEAKTGVGVSSLAGAVNLLPSSLIASTARSQSAGIDFATSNFRGAPVPVFISGAKLLQNVPIGPVAGTAFNLTLMSYANSLDMGLFVDPAAVSSPSELRDYILDAYNDLLETAGTN